jgi:hypothetical protein
MSNTANQYCEHGEFPVACLDCMAMPQPVAPRPKARAKATKSPMTENDLIAPLGGSLDISIPVDTADDLVGSSWIAAHAFPHDLRRSGWVYLRCEGSLTAKAKAKKVEWRNERAVGETDAGPGMVITVDPESWDASVDIPLGHLASRQIKGYRYLKTVDDGQVIHYSGGKPVADLLEDDEDDD